MTRKPQGHPARTNRDDPNKQLERRVYQLMREATHIVAALQTQEAPEDVVTHAQAGALSLMATYSWLTGLPNPMETRANQMGWEKV